MKGNLKNSEEKNEVLKENIDSLNLLNLSERESEVPRYRKIIEAGYCGDGICNNENEKTCCEDCGCKGNLSCIYGFCVILNYSPGYSFYQDDKLNFSVEIPNDWIIYNDKNKKGIKFKGKENTDDWFNIISIYVFPEVSNQSVHDVGVEMATLGKIKYLHYLNTTLGYSDAEKIESLQIYHGNELKQIHIITKKDDYVYILSYASPNEYFNVSIIEFNHTVNSFKFL
jgi:hypothetical protein